MTRDLRSQVAAAADRLGISPHARKKWWQRGGVPPKWRMPIIEAMRADGVVVAWSDLATSPSAQEGQNVPCGSKVRTL